MQNVVLRFECLNRRREITKERKERLEERQRLEEMKAKVRDSLFAHFT
jgi:hypothetical protein